LQNVEIQTPTEDFYEDVESIQEQIPADFHEEVKSKPLLFTELFKKLMANAQQNCSMIPQDRRHNEINKEIFPIFTTDDWPICLYKLIHANMPEAFPSLSTVEREANKHCHPLKEGEFLLDKLSAHLDAYNAPRVISISEDATRVVSRIYYDGNSESVVTSW